ncbi:MAG: LysR substrate-binding domain-containing protein [Telluria sp.]
MKRRNLPPLNGLRAFEAAARHMSFKDAADELCVTPTAISHQVRNLENLMGVRLFRRTPRTLAITEAGARLYPALKDSFDRLSYAIEHLDVSGQTLNVTCTKAFATKILIPALTQLHEVCPSLELNVNATHHSADLLKGEADVAIRYGMGDYRQYSSATLATDEYIAVASPTWLKHATTRLSLHELQASKVLRYHWANSRLPGPTWERWLHAQGIEEIGFKGATVFNEESHAIQGAIDGAGIALVSNVLVARDLQEQRLVKVHDFALPGSAFHLVFLPDSARRQTISFFNAWLTSVMRQVLHGNAPPMPAAV